MLALFFLVMIVSTLVASEISTNNTIKTYFTSGSKKPQVKLTYANRYDNLYECQ